MMMMMDIVAPDLSVISTGSRVVVIVSINYVWWGFI
jgi:hypothetical protein